jgi:hypothetical protein
VIAAERPDPAMRTAIVRDDLAGTGRERADELQTLGGGAQVSSTVSTADEAAWYTFVSGAL